MARRYSIRGSINCGPARVEVIRELENGSLEYRVTRTVLPNWGNIPKPGAIYVQQHGIGPRTQAELIRDFCADSQGGLFEYNGPAERFPYCSDEPHPDACCQRHG